MLFAKYRISDGQFLCCWPQPPGYDPATEGVQSFLEHLRPDLRLHRFDDTAPDKKRLATAQELAAYDSARTDENALSAVEVKAFQAMALVLRNYCNALKAGTYVNKSIQDVKQDLMTAWKALP